MTRLTHGKSVRRELSAIYAGRPICVELGPQTLTFRLKRTRTRYTITAITALEHAIKIEAIAIIRRRKQEREQRRKMKRDGLGHS